jgi:hypothetical protein
MQTSHYTRRSDLGLVAVTTSSVKETKFQPHAPLSHISLDAFPMVQVRVDYRGG